MRLERDIKGELDPTTVNNLLIFSNVNMSGIQRAESEGRKNIYCYWLTNTEGQWQLSAFYANMEGNSTSYGFAVGADGSDPARQPLSRATFDKYTTQAYSVMDEMSRRTPLHLISPPVN